MNISPLARWIVGIAAGIGVLIGTGKSLHDILGPLNGWHVLLSLSLLALIAVALDWYHAHIAKQLLGVSAAVAAEAKTRASAVDSISLQLTEAVRRLDDSIQALKPTPTTPQTDYDIAISLRDDVQRFLDELSQQPEPDFRLPHDAFNQRLNELGAFERKLSHGFQLRFTARLETLVHRLGEKSIEDADLTASLRQPPRNLPMLNKIREALSALASELKSKQ